MLTEKTFTKIMHVIDIILASESKTVYCVPQEVLFKLMLSFISSYLNC